MLKFFNCSRWMFALGLCALLASTARGGLVLNEIYFDPPGFPGGDDLQDEYVEIRGTLPTDAGMSLNHIYFIAVENEDNAAHNNNAGRIDSFNSLSAFNLGSNGYATLTRSGNAFSIAPGTTNITIGTSLLENSGATYLLVDIGSGAAPTNGQDLDVGNNGLDALPAGWSILDSIGIFSETGESATGLLYGAINFGPENTAYYAPNYHGVGFEIEYAGRWGNSTGSTTADWNVSNLTLDPLAGPFTSGNYRQSGDPQGAPTFIESSHSPQVPYGTILTNTLGADNYPVVPEPSTLVMGALAGFGLTLYGLRRRRS